MPQGRHPQTMKMFNYRTFNRMLVPPNNYRQTQTRLQAA